MKIVLESVTKASLLLLEIFLRLSALMASQVTIHRIVEEKKFMIFEIL